MIEDIYSGEKDDLTSDFNDAKFQILRLSNLWDRFSNAIFLGNFIDSEGANWVLDNIYGELSTDAEKKDKKQEEIQKYDYKIKRLNELIANHKDNNSKLYMILRMKERILRRLQDEAGKGTKYGYADKDGM